MLKKLLVVLVAGGIVACEQNPMLVSPFGTTGAGYSPTFVQYVAISGPFPTTIYGNPSPLPREEFNRLITERLQLEQPFPRATFSTTPIPAPTHAFRLALVFNPSERYLSGSRICRSGDGGISTLAAQPIVTVTAVFCSGDQAVTEVDARAQIPNDPRDPLFQKLLNQLMSAAMPWNSPFVSPCSNPAAGPCS
ncbi:MAG: hypothetical protein EXQ85_10415 [Alphaproteobacteria bacterium]|nr:hypothetical protein [Alphaproteobacteria bacterium]